MTTERVFLVAPNGSIFTDCIDSAVYISLVCSGRAASGLKRRGHHAKSSPSEKMGDQIARMFAEVVAGRRPNLQPTGETE